MRFDRFIGVLLPGDSITHKIFAGMNGTFVTPFDREDIHVLAAALDDVMDYMDGSASRFTLYRIRECPKRMMELIDILHQSILELQARCFDAPRPLQTRATPQGAGESE